MFSMQKIYIALGVISAIALLTVLLVMSKVEVGKLEVYNQTLQENQDTQQELIENYNDQITTLSSIGIELSKNISKNKIDLIEQQSVYNSNNLGNALAKKPTLIIKMANRKTAKVFDDFSKFTQQFERGGIDD